MLAIMLATITILLYRSYYAWFYHNSKYLVILVLSFYILPLLFWSTFTNLCACLWAFWVKCTSVGCTYSHNKAIRIINLWNMIGDVINW